MDVMKFELKLIQMAYASIWADIKTGKSCMAQDRFWTPFVTQNTVRKAAKQKIMWEKATQLAATWFAFPQQGVSDADYVWEMQFG